MKKEEKIKKLKNMRKNLIDYSFKKIDNNDNIKCYFNKYLYFSTFEIDYYYEDNHYEYIQFDLSAQNTGNIFNYKYDKKKDEYIVVEKPLLFTAKINDFDIPEVILKEIFDIARKNKNLINLEKKLTKKITKK